MLSLQDSTQKLVAVLDAAPAANQPVFLVSINGGPNAVGTLTGDTQKELLVGDDNPQPDKEITEVLIYNKDTATVNVTLSKEIDGTTYDLVREDIPAGGTLFWAPGSPATVTQGAATAITTVGASAQPEVAAAEGGFDTFRKTTLTLTAMPMTITDALAYAGKKLYDFPAGRVKILSAIASLTFTTTSTIASTLNSGVTASWGLGSATASSTTLATTMQNMVPGSGETPKTFTSSTTINVAPATVTGFLAAVSAAQLGAILDGTATAIDLFLNVAVPTGTDIDADATLSVSGTITIHWILEGDV